MTLMSMVKIVTDSTADIPKRVREQLGIEMVPLKVMFGEETYLDAVSISNSQFYEKLIASSVLPTTSQPSPVEFMETYQRILAEESRLIYYLDSFIFCCSAGRTSPRLLDQRCLRSQMT